MLHHFPRFQKDVFDENIKLLEAVEGIAKAKGVTPAQIALGWIIYMSGKKDLPTLIPIPGATTVERVKENVRPAKLSDEDFKALDEILKKFPVSGGRYAEEQSSMLTR